MPAASELAEFRLDQMALPLGREKGTETDAPVVVMVLVVVIVVWLFLSTAATVSSDQKTSSVVRFRECVYT